MNIFPYGAEFNINILNNHPVLEAKRFMSKHVNASPRQTIGFSAEISQE